ncbi:MAG: type II secretion system protein GspJ [Gammaproteobacteria bacterium]
MRKRQRQYSITVTGFTLVEIMIAMVLLSLILLLLFGGLHTASKSWQAGQKNIEASDEVRLVSNFLRREIGQMVPLVWYDGGESRIAFKGEKETIHFVSTLPAHRSMGGLYQLTLRTERQSSQYNLALDYQLVKPEMELFASNDSEEISTMTLIEDVDEITFAYFGSKHPDDGALWYDAWVDEESLPRMVRMRIFMKDGRQYWPELEFAIHTQTEKGQSQFIVYVPARKQSF